MDVKMVAIDMDGTLLYSKHEIKPRVKEAVVSAARMGVKVVLSTGRMYSSAKYYTKLMSIKAPIITCDGALIKEEDRVIRKCPIDRGPLEAALSKIKEYDNIYYQMYTEEVYYAKEMSNTVKQYYLWNKRQKLEDRINIKIISDPEDVLLDDDEVLKILICNSENVRREYENLVSELNHIQGIYCVSSMPNSVDVINQNVNKGIALKYLSDLYGIPRENIVAIGDNYNDVEMLQFAGLGIAMGNADEYVKKSADWVTASNLEDGVAIALEKYVLM